MKPPCIHPSIALRALVSLLAACGAPAAMPSGAGANGVNLVVNPGAESGSASRDGSAVAVPGWMSGNGATVVAYGTTGMYPDRASAGFDSPGNNFFAAGNSGQAESQLSQTIDLTAYATSIDAGFVNYDLHGYFGRYVSMLDYAKIEYTMLDASGVATKAGIVNLPTDANPAPATLASLAIETGMIPPRTRSILLRIVFKQITGATGEAYADEIAFVLTGIR